MNPIICALFYIIVCVNGENNIIYISNNFGKSIKYGSGKSSYSMVDDYFSRNMYNKLLDNDPNNTIITKFNFNDNIDDYTFCEIGYYGNVIFAVGEKNNRVCKTRSVGKPNNQDFVLYFDNESYNSYIKNIIFVKESKYNNVVKNNNSHSVFPLIVFCIVIYSMFYSLLKN